MKKLFSIYWDPFLYTCSNGVCGYFQTKKSLVTELHASFFSICKVSPFFNCPFPVLKLLEKVFCQLLKSVVIRPGLSIQVWISLVSSFIWTSDIQTIVELIHHTNKGDCLTHRSSKGISSFAENLGSYSHLHFAKSI